MVLIDGLVLVGGYVLAAGIVDMVCVVDVVVAVVVFSVFGCTHHTTHYNTLLGAHTSLRVHVLQTTQVLRGGPPPRQRE